MPTAPEKVRVTESLLRSVEAHAALCGLATVRSVSRALTEQRETLAAAALAELVGTNRLRRVRVRTPSGRFVYYTPERAPLRPRRLRRSFATLAFAYHQPMIRPLLDAEAFARVAAVVAGRGGPPPSWRPCYLHQARRDDAPRLSLIHMGHSDDLQRAVAGLGQFLSSPSFKLWWYFALNGQFTLTYLLPGSREKAEELGRWLRRRPVLCRFGAEPTEIPVYVYDAKAPTG